jgi:hypothetical protein
MPRKNILIRKEIILMDWKDSMNILKGNYRPKEELGEKDCRFTSENISGDTI